jgi:hypothetical protein
VLPEEHWAGRAAAGGTVGAGLGSEPAERWRLPSVSLEVNEAAFDVGSDEFDADLITDVKSLESVHDLSFCDWLGDSRPCPLSRRTCHDRVETFSDP